MAAFSDKREAKCVGGLPPSDPFARDLWESLQINTARADGASNFGQLAPAFLLPWQQPGFATAVLENRPLQFSVPTFDSDEEETEKLFFHLLQSSQGRLHHVGATSIPTTAWTSAQRINHWLKKFRSKLLKTVEASKGQRINHWLMKFHSKLLKTVKARKTWQRINHWLRQNFHSKLLAVGSLQVCQRINHW